MNQQIEFSKDNFPTEPGKYLIKSDDGDIQLINVYYTAEKYHGGIKFDSFLAYNYGHSVEKLRKYHTFSKKIVAAKEYENVKY